MKNIFGPALIAAALMAVPLAWSARAADKIVVAQAEKPAGEGVINAIDVGAHKLNMTHGPVAALKWPGMTMDFAVAPGVDLGALKKGQKVSFTLTRAASGYVIDTIKPAD